MTAPHVSGMLAAFLSMREEFVGQRSRCASTRFAALNHPSLMSSSESLLMSRLKSKPCKPIHMLSLAVFATCGVSVVVAADWPSFKPGQWQLERTMESPGKAPEKVSTTECFDPTAEQAEQRAMLTKMGCKFSPLEQSGTTYRYSANCRIGAMTSTSNSVLEVKSTEAYTITVDSVTDGTKTHEVVTARRVGECRN